MAPNQTAERADPAQRGFALWALGFRPFYLGGALFAAAAMLAWLAELDGHPLPSFHPYLPGVLWHAHEMVYGFAAAILAGFLLTAVRAWTGVTAAKGRSLAALWLLWLAGRLAIAYCSPWLAIAVDIAFLPVCAVILLRVLVRVNNRHNIFLPIAIALLAATNLAFHWSALTGNIESALRSLYVAVGFLVVFVTIIGGRIIPSFTVNAVPGHTVRSWPFVESTIAPLTLLPFLLDGFGVAGPVTALAAVVAACLHALRIAGWRPLRVGPRPILAILHIAYAWIVPGFVMLAVASLGVIVHSLAIHAFTVGVIGGAIIAMITRTARGHTGRSLVAGPPDIVCYALIVVAAIVRAAVPALAPQQTLAAIDLSGACWITAFGLYFAGYVGWLTKPRLDGKEG